ncbi:HEPN domain-containing protein [Moheibacter sp.]|uniref:HEPN domain-containing protein n=1 Tax=Moheibacter sp. TaxID=1965316 RepID=UPI003C7722AE
MNNNSVEQSINDCKDEIARIEAAIGVFGQSHHMVPYLTNYMIIKCCGTIENAFKSIISDYHNSIPAQAKNFIEQTFTNSSLNPSKENICKSLKRFDINWNNAFKTKLSAEPNCSQLESSLKSLNDARNEFAHGGHPTVSHSSVKQYFEHSVRIIEILDEIIT